MPQPAPNIGSLTPEMRNFTRSNLPPLQEICQAAFAPIFDSFRSIVGNMIASIAYTDAAAEKAEPLNTVCVSNKTQEALAAICGKEIIGFVFWIHDAPENMDKIGLTAIHPR